MKHEEATELPVVCDKEYYTLSFEKKNPVLHNIGEKLLSECGETSGIF